ncbi:MAG: tetratricopeptide repeat protein [Balneolaceae bacterium]
MSKRLSKEELESDPLIENYNRAAAYLSENKAVISSMIIGVVVIIAALIGYNFYSSVQEAEAQELLSVAESYYTQGDYENALHGDEFELTYGFSQIANDYSGTNAGNIATYYAAVSSLNLNNIEDALMYINRFDVPDGILGVGPLSFHANLLQANGSFERAAQKYLEAANWNKNETTTPFNLLKAARAFYEAGNYDRADELASQIIDEYPTSAELAESQRLKGMIAAR